MAREDAASLQKPTEAWRRTRVKVEMRYKQVGRAGLEQVRWARANNAAATYREHTGAKGLQGGSAGRNSVGGAKAVQRVSAQARVL